VPLAFGEPGIPLRSEVYAYDDRRDLRNTRGFVVAIVLPRRTIRPRPRLYYLRARYYNPNTGRFMSRDPEDGNLFDPASLHKYLYANGDPVDGVDPMGRGDLFEYQMLTWRRERLRLKRS